MTASQQRSPKASGRVAGIVALAIAGLVLSACSSNQGTSAAKGGSGDGNGTTVSIALTAQGCKPNPATVPAGKVTFEVTNKGASNVHEAELIQQGKILAERENLAPGLSGSFTLNVRPGDYKIYCPGAGQTKWPFTVHESENGKAVGGKKPSPELQKAVAGYHDYVRKQAEQLVAATEQFTAAVKSGDVDKAKSLYASTRVYYERIEPVAEKFGNLDPSIDARINDVANRSEWSGFHRIEKALWESGSTEGMDPVADQLLKDVRTLHKKTKSIEYQPASLANGAVTLLDEVAKTKITGEEERYSHTDASDITANLAGARKAFELLKPTMADERPDLAKTITTRFDEVEALLEPLRTEDGFVNYTEVGKDQRRELSRAIDALAKPLSKVAAVVA